MRSFEEALVSFERGYQNNPTLGIFAYITLTYFLLGRNEEFQYTYEQDQIAQKYIKIIPNMFKVKQAMYITPEIRDEQIFADTLAKSGMCGTSDKYYKLLKENKLTKREIEKLILDRHIGGYDFWTDQQWSLKSSNGEAIFQSGDLRDQIKVWVEEDMFCREWNNFFGGLKDCAYVYKNSDGSSESKDENILVTDYGFYGFSIIE